MGKTNVSEQIWNKHFEHIVYFFFVCKKNILSSCLPTIFAMFTKNLFVLLIFNPTFC